MEGPLDVSDQEDGAQAGQKPENLHAAVALAARAGSPLQLGNFEIDAEGRLRPRPDGTPIVFGFSYRGIDFLAEVHTGSGPRVSLSAELGKLPYRAEAGERRQMTRRVVNATEGLPRGRINLSEAQDMRLDAEAPVPIPLTPASVMAALTAILLDFKPYLDLLHEVMFAPGVPASQADQ